MRYDCQTKANVSRHEYLLDEKQTPLSSDDVTILVKDTYSNDIFMVSMNYIYKT